MLKKYLICGIFVVLALSLPISLVWAEESQEYLPEPQPVQEQATTPTPSFEQSSAPTTPRPTTSSTTTPYALPIAGSANFNLRQGLDEVMAGLTSFANYIFDHLTLLAGILAVFSVVFSGIEYITSAGKLEVTKKARARLFGTIIGVAIIVISFALVKFAISIGYTLTN